MSTGNNKKFVVKNGLISQNIEFLSPDFQQKITASMRDTGVLSFDSSNTQLFSIDTSLVGVVFSVNKADENPSVEIDDDGTIRFAEFGGHVLLGTSQNNNTDILQVNGSVDVATTLTANTLIGDGSSVTDVDAVTLSGNTASDLQSYADDAANTAYANAVSYTDGEIAALVNTAPGVLDTLNELAAAINDDPDFANSVAGQISTAYSNAVAYVDSRTTDDIDEGANNLYYTDDRARDSLSASGDLVYNSNTGELSVVTYKSSDFDTDFSNKDTDDLSEGNTNLYFTENRAVEAIEDNTVNSVSVESSFILPVGNTDSRPSPAIIGMMRFNTDLNDFEGYDGNQWVQFGASFAFEGDMNTLSGTEDLEQGSEQVDLNE